MVAEPATTPRPGLLTTVLAALDPTPFTVLIAVWLWLPVVFADLVEAAAEVEALVGEHVQGRVLGFLGEPRVDVLRLDVALEGAERPS